MSTFTKSIVTNQSRGCIGFAQVNKKSRTAAVMGAITLLTLRKLTAFCYNLSGFARTGLVI